MEPATLIGGLLAGLMVLHEFAFKGITRPIRGTCWLDQLDPLVWKILRRMLKPVYKRLRKYWL